MVYIRPIANALQMVGPKGMFDLILLGMLVSFSVVLQLCKCFTLRSSRDGYRRVSRQSGTTVGIPRNLSPSHFAFSKRRPSQAKIAADQSVIPATLMKK